MLRSVVDLVGATREEIVVYTAGLNSGIEIKIARAFAKACNLDPKFPTGINWDVTNQIMTIRQTNLNGCGIIPFNEEDENYLKIHLKWNGSLNLIETAPGMCISFAETDLQVSADKAALIFHLRKGLVVPVNSAIPLTGVREFKPIFEASTYMLGWSQTADWLLVVADTESTEIRMTKPIALLLCLLAYPGKRFNPEVLEKRAHKFLGIDDTQNAASMEPKRILGRLSQGITYSKDQNPVLGPLFRAVHQRGTDMYFEPRAGLEVTLDEPLKERLIDKE